MKHCRSFLSRLTTPRRDAYVSRAGLIVLWTLFLGALSSALILGSTQQADLAAVALGLPFFVVIPLAWSYSVHAGDTNASRRSTSVDDGLRYRVLDLALLLQLGLLAMLFFAANFGWGAIVNVGWISAFLIAAETTETDNPYVGRMLPKSGPR